MEEYLLLIVTDLQIIIIVGSYTEISNAQWISNHQVRRIYTPLKHTLYTIKIIRYILFPRKTLSCGRVHCKPTLGRKKPSPLWGAGRTGGCECALAGAAGSGAAGGSLATNYVNDCTRVGSKLCSFDISRWILGAVQVILNENRRSAWILRECVCQEVLQATYDTRVWWWRCW